MERGVARRSPKPARDSAIRLCPDGARIQHEKRNTCILSLCAFCFNRDRAFINSRATRSSCTTTKNGARIDFATSRRRKRSIIRSSLKDARRLVSRRARDEREAAVQAYTTCFEFLTNDTMPPIAHSYIGHRRGRVLIIFTIVPG